jgi:thioester reductase-like protein
MRFAITKRIKPITFISTVGVVAGAAQRQERQINENDHAAALWPARTVDKQYASGYSSSKW